MAAIALRNPRRRDDLGKIISLEKRRSFFDRFGTKDKIEAQVHDMKSKGLLDHQTALSFRETVAGVKVEDFKATKEEIIVAEIDHHDLLTERLWHRKWQMLVAADDTGGFVTTDDPVCLRWSDGQPHSGMSPGFALAGTEVIFPLSTNIALRGTFEGEENVVKSDMVTVAQLNSLIISNTENQVYAHDHTFKFKRRMPDELGSGATLLQDKDFIAAGERC